MQTIKLALLTLCILLGACAHIRTPIEPKGDKVNIPMPKGSYGYIIADNYKMADYGYIDSPSNESIVTYNAAKRNNIFYVMRFDQLHTDKDGFIKTVSFLKYNQDKAKTQENYSPTATVSMIAKRISGINCDQKDNRDEICKFSPDIVTPEDESLIHGDPPLNTAIKGSTATGIDSYQVRRKWSSSSIQAGVVYSFEKNTPIYQAAYFSIYPASYIGTSEKWDFTYPISVNIGFAGKSIWNTYDVEPDDLDDPKLLVGIGYTLESGGEIFSFHGGQIKGVTGGKRETNGYFGISLDILKVLNEVGKK